MSELKKLASRLGEILQQRGWIAATAESCTGGWIAKCITDIAGSSAWFDRGFVSYSNAAKQEMLGVDAAILEAEGAVSEATAVDDLLTGRVQKPEAGALTLDPYQCLWLVRS